MKLYYFLGNIPKNVLHAAHNGIYNDRTEEMSWAKEDVKILKDFYGHNWKIKLTGEEPTMELYSGFNLYNNIRTSISIIGGESDSKIESDLNIFGDLTFFDTNVTIEQPVTSELVFTSDSKVTYSNISVYPEDNLHDLRLKVSLLTKIPIARQFIFYFLDNQGPYYTYQISINKIPYTIKWQTMLQKSDINVNGIGIDIFFEQNKKDIEIIAYDKVVLLDKNGHKVNKVYVIDLFDIIQNKQINDKYQFDLLYYGFIIKYWPQLSPDAFKLLLTDQTKLESIYPSLHMNFDKLYRNTSIEQDIINKVHKYSDQHNYTISILNSTIFIYPKLLRMIVNIRNLFDQLILSNVINAMFINFKYGIRKQYYISKEYASIVNEHITINNPKNTISICIESNQRIILTISRTGRYEIVTQWLEDDNISFDNMTDVLSKHVGPVIDKINTLGASVFPTGGKLNKLTKDAIISMMTLSLYYSFTFSLYDFNKLKHAFKSYEEIDIIKVQGLQVHRIFSFIFYRGIIDTTYIHDGYKWLYEDIQNTGRRIRIIHRSDRLQIELNNIHSVEEYEIIKRYIFSIIDNFIKDNNLKKNKKVTDVRIKAIRKLHDLDPDLYNLNKYSDTTSYSILCQSTRQPIIYDEDEVSQISKDNANKLIKYWNFTHNKPAYYLCGSKYPYINFITGKHPKGYCLPCCKKLKDTPNTTVAKINEECMNTKKYKTEKSEASYVLAYGKTITVGRKSHAPSILYNILPNLFIYGVKQYSGSTNVGFIYSLLRAIPNCIQELATFVKDMDHYYTLANGRASIFESSNVLYNEIMMNFISNTNLLLTNIDMTLWKHILTDLVRYKYNIEIITIDHLFILHAYQDIISNISESNTESKIIILFENDEDNINLIVDSEDNAIFDSSICRSLFELNDLFVMDLIFIMTFCNKNNKQIEILYINLKNQCYGCQIDSVYIPVLASAKPNKSKISISYDIRPEPNNSRQELMYIVDAINSFKSGSIIFKSNIIYDDKLIGFESTDKLIYYHKPINLLEDSTNNKVMPYNPRHIDIAILQRKVVTDLTNKGLIKKLHNHLYNLFVSEFTSIIQKSKNKSMRTTVKQLIKDVNFLDSKSIQNMLNKLSSALKEYPFDLMMIQEFIEFTYFNMIDISNINEFIDSSTFEFDYTILHNLKELNDRDLIRNQLKDIMSPYITIGTVTNIPQYYNIFTSCIDNSNQFFCENGKLIVEQDKLNDMYDVLTNDIMNKSKTYILMTSVTGIFDYLNFIKRPHEYIKILDIKEV